MEQGTTYIINLYYIITLHNQSVFGAVTPQVKLDVILDSIQVVSIANKYESSLKFDVIELIRFYVYSSFTCQLTRFNLQSLIYFTDNMYLIQQAYLLIGPLKILSFDLRIRGYYKMGGRSYIILLLLTSYISTYVSQI